MVLAETLLQQTSVCILHSPILACCSHSACLSARATLHFAYTHRCFRFCNSNLINLRDLMCLLSTSEEEVMSRMEVSTGVREKMERLRKFSFPPQWKCLTHLDDLWVRWEKKTLLSLTHRELCEHPIILSLCALY